MTKDEVFMELYEDFNALLDEYVDSTKAAICAVLVGTGMMKKKPTEYLASSEELDKMITDLVYKHTRDMRKEFFDKLENALGCDDD